MALRMLATMGEGPAIVGALGASMAFTGVLTWMTRAGGEIKEHNGYRSISPGQPYTTDPRYLEATKAYMRFQKMNPITRMSKTGEFLSRT